jgi:hemolysin III
MDFHDRISSQSHLFMAGWSLFASAILIRLSARHTRSQRVGVAFYAVTVVTLYTASGLFHGLRHASEETRRVWQLLDQSAIFWLILGSNVPLLIYVVPRRVRNRVMGLMTGIAAAGTAALWLLPKPPHELLIAVYITMGILGFLPIRHYYARLGWRGMVWIFLLAFFYIAGGLFEAVKWPVIVTEQVVLTYHDVLHFCDIAGTVAHYILLFRVVSTTPPRVRRESSRPPHGPAGVNRSAFENRTST